jgi:hypothetical protein
MGFLKLRCSGRQAATLHSLFYFCSVGACPPPSERKNDFLNDYIARIVPTLKSEDSFQLARSKGRWRLLLAAAAAWAKLLLFYLPKRALL